MDSKSNQLKKKLGLSFGIAILIGGTIGVGILRTPGAIAGMLANYWAIIFCWVLGGVYILIGINTYAELATMLPKAGGSYNYIKRAFGDYAGFLSGWFDYILNAIPPAFYCIVIGEYIIRLFPILEGNATIIAIGFLIFFAALQSSGVKNASLIQQITSVIKVVFFTALIIACFMYSGIKFHPIEKESPLFEVGFIISFFKSLQLIIGTYDGWAAVCFFSEEDENPSKNIPKSLYLGAIIVMVLYVLINIAFFHVLPVASIANSPLAAADVAKVVFGEKGAIIVTIIAVFSLISILNAYLMIPARILFGISRDGYFVEKGTRINKGGTPIIALFISTLLALGLIIIGSFEVLFSFATIMSVIIWGLAYCSLIKLRIKEPDLERPYRSFYYPWSTLFMILSTIALLAGFAYSDSLNFLIIVLIICISYPIYLVVNHRNKKTIFKI
jgi:APA family basic amino acid/polyamine antiporter